MDGVIQNMKSIINNCKKVSIFMKNFGKILLVILVTISVLIWSFINYKSFILFWGILSGLMYINICFTTLCDILLNKHYIDDSLWKLIFIIMTCTCFSIYFTT